jgi:hypothetical protein
MCWAERMCLLAVGSCYIATLENFEVLEAVELIKTHTLWLVRETDASTTPSRKVSPSHMLYRLSALSMVRVRFHQVLYDEIKGDSGPEWFQHRKIHIPLLILVRQCKDQSHKTS